MKRINQQIGHILQLGNEVAEELIIEDNNRRLANGTKPSKPFTETHADILITLMESDLREDREIGFLAATQAAQNGWLQTGPELVEKEEE